MNEIKKELLRIIDLIDQEHQESFKQIQSDNHKWFKILNDRIANLESEIADLERRKEFWRESDSEKTKIIWNIIEHARSDDEWKSQLTNRLDKEVNAYIDRLRSKIKSLQIHSAKNPVSPNDD